MDTTMPDHVVDQPKGSKGFKPGKGGPSPNPSGVAVPDGGVITAEKMRKVLGQGKNSDSGPTESRLREWLDKDVKGYQGKIEELEAGERRESKASSAMAVLLEQNAELRVENERLKAERASGGRDAGSARAMALIDAILAEVHE